VSCRGATRRSAEWRDEGRCGAARRGSVRRGDAARYEAMRCKGVMIPLEARRCHAVVSPWGRSGHGGLIMEGCSPGVLCCSAASGREFGVVQRGKQRKAPRGLSDGLPSRALSASWHATQSVVPVCQRESVVDAPLRCPADQPRIDPLDQTILTYMDTGEPIPCDIVVLRDAAGSKIHIT
jgi:hypothetical protein